MTNERKNEILNLIIDWLDYHNLPDLVDELMSELYELDTALSDGITFIDDHIHDKEDKELAWKEVIGLTKEEMDELHISDMYDYLEESKGRNNFTENDYKKFCTFWVENTIGAAIDELNNKIIYLLDEDPNDDKGYVNETEFASYKEMFDDLEIGEAILIDYDDGQMDELAKYGITLDDIETLNNLLEESVDNQSGNIVYKIISTDSGSPKVELVNIIGENGDKVKVKSIKDGYEFEYGKEYFDKNKQIATDKDIKNYKFKLNESEDEPEEVRFDKALNKFLSDTDSRRAPSGDKSLEGGWFSIPIIFKDSTEGKFYWTGRTPNERADVTIHKKDINSYGTDIDTLIRRVNKILDKNISINKASLEDISLNDIRNKALNLGYEVIDDERDPGNTILIYKTESTEEDNFDDFDNEALYKYLAKLPSVESQIDDEDPSCLAVWLKDTIDEKKELTENVKDKSDLQSDLEDIFNTMYKLRNRLATHEAEEFIDKIYEVLEDEINNGVFVDCDTDDLIG